MLVERAVQNHDIFVELSAKTEEVKQTALEVRDAYNKLDTQFGIMGTNIFPRTEEVVSINPDQEDLLAMTTMSMLEQNTVLDLHRRFTAWLNRDMAPRIQMHTETVPTKEGGITIVPLRLDYGLFRDALLSALVVEFLREESDAKKSRLTLLPSATR